MAEAQVVGLSVVQMLSLIATRRPLSGDANHRGCQ